MLLRKVYRDIVIRRVRSALTLLGVVVGVAGLVAIVTMAQGFARAQQAVFASGARADLSIRLHNAPESLVRVIARQEGVLAADLRFNHYGQGRLSDAAGLENLHFLGLRDFSAQVADRLVLESGHWPEPDEALVEPAAAQQYGLSIGDTIWYRDFANRLRPLTLSGIARLPNALSSELTALPYLFVRDSVVQAMLDVPGYDELLVRFEPGAQREEVASAIITALEQRRIPRSQPTFSDPNNFVGKRELDALFLMLYLFSGLGIVLNGFLVANTIAALVAESVREIGILKALGATRWQVLGSFLLAATLYGVAGTLVGLLAGSGLGWVLLRVLGRFISLEPPFRVEPMALALGTAVGVGLTLLGGALPAWQASGITAKEALDNRGVSRRFGRGGLDRLVQRLSQLPPLLAMSLRNLVRRKGRSGVTMLVVALAVGGLLAAQTTDRSVSGALDDIFTTYVADAYLQFGEAATSDDAGALRRVSGVSNAEAWLLRDCTAAYAATRCWAMPAATTLYRPILTAGQWLDPRDPLGVVLSSDLAAAQGLQVGDRFPLRYRDAERAVTVRGIVTDNAIFLGSNVQSKVFVPRETFAPMTGRDNAADIFALALGPNTLPEQQAILEEVDRKLAALRPSSTLALTEFEASQQLTSILTTALRGMVLLVALVGAAGLVNTLALNVLERRREIGVLRSLGTDNAQISFLFITEGLGLGALGWLVGLGLGWLMGQAFVQALSTALFDFVFRFPPSFLLTSLGFSVLLALLSSLAPALAAANIPTAEAIRYE
ncbi:MAG TPA: FtsX-like permease family protein [Ardenticatenaceae bacterium]|jgi:putative ABC transport system permease protein